MTSDMTSEEQPVKMTGQEDNAVRMAGYLDKRGKMKLVTTWKRYWFVLKDQLLLYYKSQAECLNLSACRGSLNMGLVSSVRPGAHRGPPATAAQGFTIEVETRTQVVVLRTKHRSLQEQWLKALLESVALPNISSPLRTGGGPVHFRYSMENLPVIEETKIEDKKEQTLPHQTSVTSQDNVLGRIKRIGGQSYGGSLDTILRHQPKAQKQPQWSPQQPKIPRIKAVDRMLGVHYLDSTENTEILISENQTHSAVNEERCLSDSTCSASKDEVLLPNGREEIKCNEVLLHRPLATSSDIQEVREISFKLRGDERNKQTKVAIFERGENKNNEKLNVLSIEKARKFMTDFLENERYVYSSEKEEEIIVENKLYEKTKAVENEDEEKIYEETKEIEQKFDCCEVENKLYEKNKPDKEDKQYDSLEEFTLSRVREIREDEKMYEVVSATVDAVKQVKEDVQSLEDKEENDYYCSYDKFSLMHLLSDQRNSSSPEPDLPPRPSGGSIDSPKSHLSHENTKTDDEEAEYSVYYESTESYNTSTSPSHLLSNGDGSEKKGSKLRVRMKLRKKKSPNKEVVSSEDGSKNSKRKRKISFLRRMLKHYRKKPEYNSEAVVISDNRRISAEPEYESVDYLASMLKHEVTEEELPEHASRSKSTESLDKAVLKGKLFGTKNLLTEQAMNELKMKLKCRDNAAQIEPPVYTKEENKGHEGVSPYEILEKKPVPTPRSKKERVNQDKKVCAGPHKEETPLRS